MGDMAFKTPRLRHENDGGLDRLERGLHFFQRRQAHQVGQIKTETIDIKGANQVHQAVDDEPPAHGRIGAQIVAAATPIRQTSFVVADKIIILVDGKKVVGLADVVVNHIENHRQPGVVKGLDDFMEFRDLRAMRRIRPIRAGRRKIIHRHITPVVIFDALVVEFLHGLQLHGVDSQLPQIAIRLAQPFGKPLKTAALFRR